MYVKSRYIYMAFMYELLKLLFLVSTSELDVKKFLEKGDKSIVHNYKYILYTAQLYSNMLFTTLKNTQVVQQFM